MEHGLFHFGINYCLAFVGICSLRLSCYSSKSRGNLKIYSNIKTKAVVLKVSYYFDFLYIWKCLTYLRLLLIHLDLLVSFISVREVQSWTSPSLISGCKMVSLFCTRLASIRLSYLFPLLRPFPLHSALLLCPLSLKTSRRRCHPLPVSGQPLQRCLSVGEWGFKSKQSGSRVYAYLLSTLNHRMWTWESDLNCLGLNFLQNEKVGFDRSVTQGLRGERMWGVPQSELPHFHF